MAGREAAVLRPVTADLAAPEPSAGAGLPFGVLAERLNGRLVVTTDTDYDAQRRLWNAMFDRRPSAIARCTGTADVIAALAFAREHDVPFTICGGRHSADGKALMDGALGIDLGPMRGVLVDRRRRRATVQASPGSRSAAASAG
jgi:FAD/FMN-containing dehydrogenase